MVWKDGPEFETCQNLEILGIWCIWAMIWGTKQALEAKSQKCGEQKAYKIIAAS